MKKALALAMTVLCGGGALAAGHDSDAVVSWSNIVGVITAPGIDNPVASTIDANGNVFAIHSGTLPWTTRTGHAHVDLRTGAAEFRVRGLVMNGGNATGTAGSINQVVGTLVCNPGSDDVNRRARSLRLNLAHGCKLQRHWQQCELHWVNEDSRLKRARFGGLLPSGGLVLL